MLGFRTGDTARTAACRPDLALRLSRREDRFARFGPAVDWRKPGVSDVEHSRRFNAGNDKDTLLKKQGWAHVRHRQEPTESRAVVGAVRAKCLSLVRHPPRLLACPAPADSGTSRRAARSTAWQLCSTFGSRSRCGTSRTFCTSGPSRSAPDGALPVKQVRPDVGRRFPPAIMSLSEAAFRRQITLAAVFTATLTRAAA